MATRAHSREISSARHLLNTIKSTARSMVIAGLTAAVLGIVVVELYGYATLGSFAPVATHVLAVAVGLVCAYGAIVTVLLRGMIATLVDSVEWVAAEIESLTSTIVHQAETVEGSVFHRPDERDDYARAQAVREPVGSHV